MTTARPGDYIAFKGKNVTVRYRPANRKSDLRPGSRMESMKEFLMSDRIQDVTLQAAEDIAGEARGMAIEQGIAETGRYVSSFDAVKGPPAMVAGNLRRTAHVTNDAVVQTASGTYSVAADVEWGTSKTEGKHIIARAGMKYHTPKGIA